MAIKIERYKSNNKKSKSFHKYYGRIVYEKKTVDIRKMAQHIQAHGSIYTYDTIVGVLAKAEQCIPELLAQGYKVKLDGLGTFKLYALSTGDSDPLKWSIQTNLKKLRVRFAPEQRDFSHTTSAAFTRAASSEGFELLPYLVEKGNPRTITYLEDGSGSGADNTGTNTGDNTGTNTGDNTEGGQPAPERP